MKRLHLTTLILLMLAITGFALSCSDDDDSDSTTSLSTSNSGVAAVAAFSSAGDQASLFKRVPRQLLDLLVETAIAQSGGTCSTFSESATVTPATDVSLSANGTAGTFGAASGQVTVADTDFCENSSGDTNTGTGPDGEGLYAAFSFSNITIDCSDDTEGSLTGSGIYRDHDSVSVPEQILGSFEAGDSTVNCTIDIDTDGDITSATCTDSQDAAIEQVTSVTCTATPSS